MNPDLSVTRARRVDKAGVYASFDSWPEMAEKGAIASPALKSGTFSRAVFLGMGGSASAGDIVADWLSIRQEPSFVVYKGFIPETDLSGALAIACSASGNTKETIQMLELAVKRGATAVTISSGGELEKISKRLQAPHVQGPAVLAPRYILPFLVFALVSCLNESFQMRSVDSEVRSALSDMRRLSGKIGIRVPLQRNQSKRLALAVLKCTPVVYGSTVTRGAAYRFKNSLNENAKKHALADYAPELFHNEVETWEGGEAGFLPVFLRHSKEPESERRRFNVMQETLSKDGVDSLQVRGDGGSDLGELITMVYKLDVASYFTAIALGIDPLPTRMLSTIKKET